MAAASDQQVRLAEYAALRAEITQRSSFQQAIIALDLTVIATIAGFAITGHRPLLVLVIPVVSSTLGLLWLDHHRSIQRIATYIREELWHWEPSWEGYRNVKSTGDDAFFSAVTALFALSSAVALGFEAARASVWGEWGFWGISVLFVVAYGIESIRTLWVSSE